jgi:hypothetical protein
LFVNFEHSRVLGQAAWSVASSVAAFFAILLPTAGLSLRQDHTFVSLVVVAIWQAYLVAAVSSLGLPTLIGPLSARAAGGSLAEIDPVLGRYAIAHLAGGGILGVIVAHSPLSGLPQDGPVILGFVALCVAASAQTTGNNYLGGAFRNELVLLINTTTACALAVAVFVVPHESPGMALAAIGLASMARPLALTVIVLTRKGAGIGRPKRPLSQWTFAYLLTLATVVTFQRFEVAFLKERGTSEDIAAFGVAFDIAQFARGLATSSFAVLIPVFVVSFAANAPRTVERARLLALTTVALVSTGGASLILAARLTGQIPVFLGGADPLVLALVISSASLAAGGAVTGQLLLSQMKYGEYLGVVTVTLLGAFTANALVTTDAMTAGLASLLGASTFILCQGYVSSRLGSYRWMTRLVVPAWVCAFVPLFVAAPTSPIHAAVGGIVGVSGVALIAGSDFVALVKEALPRKDQERNER